mgnify:CR=1 FL=1
MKAQTPKVKFIPIGLPAELHRAARIKSATTGQSITSVVVQKLTEWVNEQPRRAQRRQPSAAETESE